MASKIDEKRGTGRTTRMIEEAVREARKGRQVYILAGSDRDEIRLRSLLPQDVQDTVTVVSDQTLGYLIDPYYLRLSGVDPDHLLLIDHYYIEHRYGKLIDMWMRYD